LVSLVVCSAAVYIAALRWSNLSARLAAIAFMTGGLSIAAVVLIEYPGLGRRTSALAIGLISFHRPWELPLMYDFCSRFPRPIEETRLATWLRLVLYTCAALMWIPFNVPVWAQVGGISPLPALGHLIPFRPDGQYGSTIIAGFESIAALLSCLVLVRNYRRIRNPGARLRMRWAGLSIASTIFTFLLFAFLKLLWNVTGSEVAGRWAEFVDDTGTFVVGLSFLVLTYAVAKYRVFGIGLAIRQGLRYLLAKNILRSMIVFPFLVAAGKALENPDEGLRHLVMQSSWPSYSVLAAAGVLGLRYQMQIRPWLDRRFFRVALGQEQMLVTLMDRIRLVESEDELCLIAGRQMEEGLHINGCHIFLGDRKDRLRIAYSQSPDRASQLRDWLNSEGTQFLNADSPFTLHEVQESIEDEDTYVSYETEHLIIPISGVGLKTGVALALGPKRSEEPYTARDHELLKGIAGQMATVREMLQLKKRVEQEGRTRVHVLGHLDRRQVQLLTECPDCGRCYTTSDSTCADDGASVSLTLPVERVIDGKYLLERRLGRGGMGVVFRATDIRLSRPVAIKIMVADLFGNHAAVSRFSQEARTIAALNHPNIVAVHDFGRLPTGGAYLVMELVQGESWRRHLTAGRSMTLQRAYSSIRQLCEAVEAAHTGGVIHRDLKPENIMIADDWNQNRVIVLDFGLAKFHPDLLTADETVTLTGVVMGTLGYMSPEQRLGRKVDASSDVYSIAVICVETLTGSKPPRFEATSEWLNSAFRNVESVHKPLFRVLERALARNPWERPLLGEILECLPRVESLGSEVRLTTANAEILKQPSPDAGYADKTLTPPPSAGNAAETLTPPPDAENAAETLTPPPSAGNAAETLTPPPDAENAAKD
jgi:serine/threonine protein kinase